MNIKKLIEKVTENWSVKILCFALAVFIYMFHIISMLDRKSLIVPLNVVADGILVPLDALPQNIKVTVRAKSDVIATITSSGISAQLYLTDFTEPGVYDVPISVSLSNELMLVEPLEVFVKPDKIPVLLDKKVQKYLSVEPSISGEPSHGYVIHSVSVVPSSVKVVGPASIVEKTECIYTDKVNVKGASKGLSAVVGLDSTIKILTVLPEEDFRVTVAIEEAKTSATFKDITPHILHLNDDLLINSAVPSVSFTIEGSVSQLEKYKLTDSTVSLDCASILQDGEYTLPFIFSLPQGLSVGEYSPKTALLAVIVKNPVLSEDETDIDDNFEELDALKDIPEVDATTDVQNKNDNDGDVNDDNKEEGEIL